MQRIILPASRSAHLIKRISAVFAVCVLFCSCIFFVAACSETSPQDDNTPCNQTPQVEIALGRGFELSSARRAVLRTGTGGEELSICFDSVLSDSRCPLDVVCVWQGNAEVRLFLKHASGAKSSITLNTTNYNPSSSMPFPKEAQFQGYTIELQDLMPYPNSQMTIAHKDYKVRLLVSKKE